MLGWVALIIIFTLGLSLLLLHVIPGTVTFKTAKSKSSFSLFTIHRQARIRGRKDEPHSQERPRDEVIDRWNALFKCDDEIHSAADQLRPFGDRWVSKLGRAFLALNERSNVPAQTRPPSGAGS